ncbi:hypothetical protein GCM10009839_10820 [Catenulispora yoronensis]|uniref:DUF4232 domain-containing protein n=1 Tax=Catenulispora yoronensis TaxID=450799 RepID=A0ABP5F541_9ACTN
MLKLAVSALREPINHVLITATNTSKSHCRLNGYPFLKYDPDQQAPVAAADATKPATTIDLAPGDSAYAGVLTSSADGSGKNGKDRPTIDLQLASVAGGGLPGSPSKLAMPKGAQYVDDSAMVTYWVTDLQAALY